MASGGPGEDGRQETDSAAGRGGDERREDQGAFGAAARCCLSERDGGQEWSIPQPVARVRVLRARRA